MAHRPHLPSAPDVLRVVVEHAAIVACLLTGLVLGAFLRDESLPPLLPLEAWLDPGGAALHLGAFGARLHRFRPELAHHVAWDVMTAATLQYAMHLHGLYDRRPVQRARLLLLLLVRSSLLAGVVVSVVFFFARPPELGRLAIVAGLGLATAGLWAGRTLRRDLIVARPDSLLVAGSGPVVDEAIDAVAAVPAGRYRLVGRVGEPAVEGSVLPHLGGWDELPALVEALRIDRVLLASTPERLAPIVSARLSGVRVVSARAFAESITGQVLEEDPGAEFVIDATSRAYGPVSRIADALLSAVLLAALSPILALCAAAAWLTSGSPVLFSQVRVGRGGRPFRLWKLRTMRADAEARGPAWAAPSDPRITRLGRVLRRWRLDEIPQLWNVLIGDMAFVGPRPEQPHFVERLSGRLPHYGLRHLVRPGLTGWAQVKLPYASSEEDARRKLRHDLFYVKHRSAELDLVVLFDTVKVVILGRGR